MRIINLIFWQNIVSIHQRDILNELSGFYNVLLFVEKELDEYRKEEKWEVPKSDLYTYEVIKSKERIRAIFNHYDQNSSIHIFSGIGSYKLIHSGFKNAVLRKCHIGIMSETLNPDGIKGILRSIKTHLFKIKYNRKIDFILTIGGNGNKWFLDHGFDKDKLFLWGYFLKQKTNIIRSAKSKKRRILFIGRLVKQKGIIPLIQIANECSDDYDQLCIIGKGPLKKEIVKSISNNPILKSKISLIDYLPNNEILEKISEYDLLVLSSIQKEGWGVVINEALMVGTPVIASSICGASILLDGSERGEIYQAKDKNKFKYVFRKWSQKSKDIDQQKIMDWSTRISAESNATYFHDILAFIYQDKSVKPLPPWIASI